MRLEGKRAVVVGAGQTPGETIGNGRATAVLFAREGAEVLLIDRDLAVAQDVEAEITEAGGRAHSFQADITNEEECKALVDEAVSKLGGIDVLHNNVGIGSHDASATRITEEGLDHILNVNLKGVVWTCKYALPVMRPQQSGSIINISSIAGVTPFPGVGYNTSKAALNAYTQSLAIGNARHGIRVNAILPGLMNTPMAIEANLAYRKMTREELIAQRDAMVPLGRKMGTGWDVGYAALFLASDESQFITGVCLPVDGGATARVG